MDSSSYQLPAAINPAIISMLLVLASIDNCLAAANK